MAKPTFVIADVHGHYDRLFDLLRQEEIIDDNGKRVNFDVEVGQLGDLGHFGGSSGSPTGDMLCYKDADDWFDWVLLGNHDAAVFNMRHAFKGYEEPKRETLHYMRLLKASGKLRYAHASHGYLVTHAGVHPYFFSGASGARQLSKRLTAEEIANRINLYEDRKTSDIINAISAHRGGGSPYGGVLWRHAGEALYKGVPQVFGHTKGKEIRRYGNKSGSWSLCIDLGDAKNGRLAGVWLPEGECVEIELPDHS